MNTPAPEFQNTVAEPRPEFRPERPLKVAVLNRVFARSGGGAESYSIAVVEQLASTHEVHVFAQQIAHEWPGVYYHRISSPGEKPRWLNQLWYAWATWRATHKGFDIVHSHENTWHGNVQTIHVRPLRFNLLAKRSGMALVLRWTKIALSPRLLTYVGLESARFRPQARRQIAVASASLGQEVVQMYPQARAMLQVVPPGVTLPSVLEQSAAAVRQSARQAWQLAETAYVLLFVANDYARKGLDALLLALVLLPEQVMLLVVGNPHSQAEYAKQVRALGLGPRVVFAGALSDVSPAYRAADALVHPTLEDSFGMVVLEAMSCALPVVVSGPNWCGAASLLHDGVDSLVLQDPQDASAIANSVQRLLQEPGLASQLGAQALQLAHAHTWAAVGEAYARLYAAAVAQAKPPV